MAALSPLRIGILGAARIAPMALIAPARKVPEATVVAIAARDPARARAFATKHGIPRAYASYEALIADPAIDAVYNPLPNSLHAPWTIAALQAGKHVLCEKPLTANAEEAERVAAVAASSGRVLMEAFHYRYHPLAARVKAIADSGELGAVRHIEAQFCIPLLRRGDIRYRYDLAGGATMDVGCYTIDLVRFLAGAEPEVIHAEAHLIRPQIDRWMAADLRFADGRTGRVVHALLSAVPLRITALVRGDAGDLRVTNPFVPQLFHRIVVRAKAGRRVERVSREATYTYQLRAFLGAVRGELDPPTGPANAIANMRVIDAVYRKAGLQPRGM